MTFAWMFWLGFFAVTAVSHHIQAHTIPSKQYVTQSCCRAVAARKIYTAQIMLKDNRLIPQISAWFMRSWGRPIVCRQSTYTHTRAQASFSLHWSMLLCGDNVIMLSTTPSMRLCPYSRLNEQFALLSSLVCYHSSAFKLLLRRKWFHDHTLNLSQWIAIDEIDCQRF